MSYQLVDPDPPGLLLPNQPCFSPFDPRPASLPSNFDHASWQGPVMMTKRSEPTRTMPPQNIVSFDRIYGPTSRGKASLRYYGNGPY